MGIARVILAASLVAALTAAPATADSGPRGRERVVSSPFVAGGYPGAKPAPGGCIAAPYDANFSEAALAAQPGGEQLVGAAKAYFNKWSTFKAYHNAAFVFGGGGDVPARTTVVGGFDCVSTGTQAMPPSWTNATDPNLAWDLGGRVHQVALPFNAYWGSVEQPNGNIYGIYSDDKGRTWRTGNGGAPIQAGPDLSTQSQNYVDKPWVAVNQIAGHRWSNHVYGVWVQFNDDADRPPEIRFAVSRDRGATWSAPQSIPTAVPLGPSNPWPHIAVDAGGAVQLTYVTYGERRKEGDLEVSPTRIWSARSTDDGRTWSASTAVADTTVIRSCCLPGTRVHDGVVEYLDASRERPGHAYVTYERYAGGHLDVMLTATRNGGATWSRPVRVNARARNTDQFQPQVAAGPGGAVAVAFYDKRWACPDSSWVLPGHAGTSNRCIATVVQGYRDTGRGLVATSRNVRVTRRPWDPEQPAQRRDGIGQLPCEDPEDPCNEIFVGDYFGLAVTPSRIQVLSSSTAYPSTVRADEGGRIHYQQQVLSTLPRAAVGLALRRRGPCRALSGNARLGSHAACR